MRLYLIIAILFFSSPLICKESSIILASTTSTSDSGLLNYLNEYFEDKFNIKIHVLSLGTGQALRTAQDGNVEVVLVHHKNSELKFIENGFGLVRHNLMYNDFIIVGPKEHKFPCFNIKSKLEMIHKKKLTFISRGDDSGTHKKEIELWNLLKENNKKSKSWYLESGQGMGKTLLIANNKKAYTLSDRSTWRTFKKKNNLKIICEGKPPLINQYGIILVKNSINTKEAKKYIEWIISDKGKKLINDYKIDKQQLFFFNHH